MSAPGQTARFGEVARPEGDDDAETSQGPGTQNNGEVGLEEENAEKPVNRTCQLTVETRTN